MTFNDLGLIEPILRAVTEKGYEEPTPIQEQAIPHVLAGKDVIGCAQTGTGKTAAFAIPIIQRTVLHEEEHGGGFPYLTSLIISPTRELASQIGENIEAYAQHTLLKHAVIYGGVHQKKQVEAVLGGIHLLVATPGRLLDLMGQGIVHIDMVETLVLDEADRMLDMGFIDDIRTILARCPTSGRPCCSRPPCPLRPTNWPAPCSPIRSASRSRRSPPRRDHPATGVPHERSARRSSPLVHILDQHKVKQGLSSSCAPSTGRDQLARALRKKRIRTAAIHGNKDQKDREWARSIFRRENDPACSSPPTSPRGASMSATSVRHQLRRAGRGRELRPPHRAVGARRRGRHGHHHCDAT